MQAASVISSASTTIDLASYVVSDVCVSVMTNDESSSTTPAIQMDFEASEIDVGSQEDISEIEYASIELTVRHVFCITMI